MWKVFHKIIFVYIVLALHKQKFTKITQVIKRKKKPVTYTLKKTP